MLDGVHWLLCQMGHVHSPLHYHPYLRISHQSHHIPPSLHPSSSSMSNHNHQSPLPPLPNASSPHQSMPRQVDNNNNMRSALNPTRHPSPAFALLNPAHPPWIWPRHFLPLPSFLFPFILIFPLSTTSSTTIKNSISSRRRRHHRPHPWSSSLWRFESSLYIDFFSLLLAVPLAPNPRNSPPKRTTRQHSKNPPIDSW